MREIESYEKRYLTWVQPKFGVDHFELRDGEDVYADLYWTKLLSDRAVARCGRHTWTMDRLGFFRRRLVAMQAGAEEPSASFEIGWLGEGELQVAGVGRYSWYRTKVLGSAWAIADQDKDVLLEIQFGMHWFKHEAYVVLRRTPKAIPEMGLLICFAFYLGYCTMQDAAGAVAATSAAAVIG